MNGPEFLKQFENTLKTTYGACFPGTRAVFRGLDLHSNFKDSCWMDLYVYGVTGKRLQPNQLRVLEHTWACSSYPDIRLWNNRIAALAGSVRSPGGTALCGALAASDTQIMGRQVDSAIADFLWRALAMKKAGKSLEDIVREERKNSPKGIIRGYGRPVATDQVDERIPHMLAIMARENVPIGEHVQLGLEIETVLEKVVGRKLPATYGPMITGICLDFGFHPREVYLFDFCVFLAGMHPCYQDGMARAEGASFILSCEHLKNHGPKDRIWEA